MRSVRRTQTTRKTSMIFPHRRGHGRFLTRFRRVPTQEILADTRREKRYHLEKFHWGLVFFWARDTRIQTGEFGTIQSTGIYKAGRYLTGDLDMPLKFILVLGLGKVGTLVGVLQNAKDHIYSYHPM